jgi:hypothetical protein
MGGEFGNSRLNRSTQVKPKTPQQVHDLLVQEGWNAGVIFYEYSRKCRDIPADLIHLPHRSTPLPEPLGVPFDFNDKPSMSKRYPRLTALSSGLRGSRTEE